VGAASASFCEEGDVDEGEGRENDAGAANGGDVDMRDAEVRTYEGRELGLTRWVSLLNFVVKRVRRKRERDGRMRKVRLSGGTSTCGMRRCGLIGFLPLRFARCKGWGLAGCPVSCFCVRLLWLNC
jgi:hypothetical protein